VVIDARTGWYVMPLSVKGVVRDARGHVLLGLNEWHEWDLPGGRPDFEDIDLEATLVRETFEETGLKVRVDELIDTWIRRVRTGERVAILTYSASVIGGRLVCSPEHTELRFFPVASLPPNMPEGYRRSILRGSSGLDPFGGDPSHGAEPLPA
jgi:8-oxo-dGTP diphosphatase